MSAAVTGARRFAVVQAAGSVLFTAYLLVSWIPFALVALFVGAVSYRGIYAIADCWAGSVLWLCRVLCGIRWQVEGAGNIPAQNGVALWKHSSAFETLAEMKVFGYQTWVLKRELVWIPLFGWALRWLKPIAINRGAGRQAVEQVVRQGAERLRDGLWVMIFPEGTRTAVGETRRYGVSGSLLASRTGVPVVPVAHNAGLFWPRRGWLKRPGTVRIVIGPPIATAGRDPRQINAEAQAWIEAKVAELVAADGVDRSAAPT